MTDQHDGDLFSIITQLLPAFPPDGGVMPIGELLQHLQKEKPQVFSMVDQLSEAARRVSGLSEEMAQLWKEKGNKEFASRQLQQCILTYTQGLVCAETDETMATLLNNRSTAFFQMKRYADACVDADHAIRFKTDYWKALQRRGRALQELGFDKLGTADVEAAVQESMELANDRATMDRLLGEVASGCADSALPPRVALRAAVRVDRSAKGRGLVATQRLECGTVLEETPYALVARTEALLSACSYCLQCTTCLYHGEEFRRAGVKSRGFFCSEACATAAWKSYGEVESAYPFFLCCPNDALLASRMLRGLQAYPELASADGMTEDFDPVSHNQLGASHIRTLEGSHSKELNPTAVNGGCESIVAALALYMGAMSEADAEGLRKAQRQILLNAMEVSCMLRTSSRSGDGKDDKSTNEMLHTNTTAVVGKAIYAVSALVNHGCDPNCYASFVGNPQGSSAKLVLRAIRPIMEGEELTIAYSGISRFSFHSMRNRVQTLRDRFGFICRCATCVSQVDEPVRPTEKEYYIKASDYYQKGRRLIREGDYATAVTVLLQSYEIVMRYICPPPTPPQVMIPKTHDALALAYYHLRNREKCAEHLRAELETDIAIHHTDNRVEMINEYTRLAFIASSVEEKKKYAGKAGELLKRFFAPSSLLDIQVLYVESSYRALESSTKATAAAAPS